MYGAAFVLVLAAAAFLLIGLIGESVRSVVTSVLASGGALVLLWAGVVRDSGPPERDGHG